MTSSGLGGLRAFFLEAREGAAAGASSSDDESRQITSLPVPVAGFAAALDAVLRWEEEEEEEEDAAGLEAAGAGEESSTVGLAFIRCI
jgi:hypothetical protein